MRILRPIILAVSLFTAVGTYAQTTTLILTRHAEKLAIKDRDPALSEKGVERAAKLAQTLSEIPISAIYSTNYKRTKLTVDPTSAQKGIDVQIYDPRNQSFIKELIEKEKGGTVLISGHSNTIPAMINQVANTNYPNFGEKDYDDLVFIVIKPDEKPLVIWLKHN